MAINNNIIGEANQPSPHGGEMVRGFKNVFVKPDEQNRACSSYAMARKGARSERIFDDMNNGFGWDRLPKILHGREHGVSSAYGTHTQLL